MSSLFARVHVLDAPYFIDKKYDYYVPSAIQDRVCVGSVVSVPFGKGNKSSYAVVFELTSETEYNGVKSVLDIVTGVFLNDEILRLCEFLKDRTLCTIGDAVKSAVPISAFGKMYSTYTLAENVDIDSFNEKSSEICLFIKNNPKARYNTIKQKFGEGIDKALRDLTTAGILIKETEIQESAKKTESLITLVISDEEALECIQGKGRFKLRGDKLKAVVSALVENGKKVSESELKGMTGAGKAQIRSLAEKNIVWL